jgi:hypothetical protein
MRFSSAFVRGLMLVLAFAVLPLAMPATTSAQATTIYAELGRCRTNVDLYQVQLQAGDQRASSRVFPASVTIHFADGSTTEATPYLGPNFGTQYYYSYDLRESPVTGATAHWNTTAYPNYSFTVTARPCVPDPVPTYSVSGTIVQHGNQNPVVDLTVCLVELERCTTTDADGYFSIAGVENGTYTLSSDGSNWKPQTNSVTVADSNVSINLVQYKGGGR